VKPRLGFLGLGWIGQHRLKALIQSEVAEVVAFVEPTEAHARTVRDLVSCAQLDSLEQLLDRGLDGLVVATPSALHAAQSIAALERGIAVFCQKPLGRNAKETTAVVAAARSADRLLGVDLSYRHLDGASRIRELIRSGELGAIYAGDLVFHNAYGPDKPWFYDPTLSGGGCVIDLGIHLVDLILWMLEDETVARVSSHLFAGGQPLADRSEQVEDFAIAELELDSGAVIRLACSWNLPAGCDAVIEATFFGTNGGARLSNVDGSFYDFTAERLIGTSRATLCGPSESWGGRALIEWAGRLAQGGGFDTDSERLIEVAAVVDEIYGAGVTAALV
jgi:predicted dehydrogenase